MFSHPSVYYSQLYLCITVYVHNVSLPSGRRSRGRGWLRRCAPSVCPARWWRGAVSIDGDGPRCSPRWPATNASPSCLETNIYHCTTRTYTVHMWSLAGSVSQINCALRPLRTCSKLSTCGAHPPPGSKHVLTCSLRKRAVVLRLKAFLYCWN